MSEIYQRMRMRERLDRKTVPIPKELAALGVSRLSFTESGDLLVIRASLFDRPRKRYVTAEYHEPEWWRPETDDQAQKLVDALCERLREKVVRSKRA